MQRRYELPSVVIECTCVRKNHRKKTGGKQKAFLPDRHVHHTLLNGNNLCNSNGYGPEGNVSPVSTVKYSCAVYETFQQKAIFKPRDTAKI